MATEAERKAAVKQAEADEQKRFADWKKQQEDAGHTVVGSSFADAAVAELPDGPTHNIETP